MATLSIGVFFGPSSKEAEVHGKSIEFAQETADTTGEAQMILGSDGSEAIIQPRPRGQTNLVALSLGEKAFDEIFKRKDRSTGFIGNGKRIS